MKRENIYCDYCEKLVSHEGQKKYNINGFCIKDIGYSEGGWGSRKDFITNESVEICDDCFNVIKEKVKELKDTIKNLKP